MATLRFCYGQEIIVLYIVIMHDNTKGVYISFIVHDIYLFILRNMKEMKMDYVNVQKESIDKSVEAMSLEGPKNSLRFIQQKARGNAWAFY